MSDLQSILLAAYHHAHNGGRDPIVDTVMLDKAALQAKRDELSAVEARCYVSKVQRQFLDRALALDPVWA
jgi:hypothetical protein